MNLCRCSSFKRVKVVALCNWVVYIFSFVTVLSILKVEELENQSGPVTTYPQFPRDVPSDTTDYAQPPRGEPSDTELYSAVNDDVARELWGQQRVLCWIMTGPANHERKARVVKETWGRRCNILLFMSTESDDSLPTVKLPLIEGRETLWGKTKEAFRYVWENYQDEADWFMKADDDSYVILENLRYVLSAYNSSEPLYFGHRNKPFVDSGYMQGGAGYVLSKEALQQLVEKGLDNPGICKQGPFGAEDLELGICMKNLVIKCMDTRDPYKRYRFLSANPWDYIDAEPVHKGKWLWVDSYYRIKRGVDCCSDTVVSFHYLTPKGMYFMDFFIYHVQPYGILNYRHQIQRWPALPPDVNVTAPADPPPSDAEEEVYQEFKKRESVLQTKLEAIRRIAKEMDNNETLRLQEIANRKIA